MRYRHYNCGEVSLFILGSDIESITTAKEMFPTFFMHKPTNFGMVGIESFIPSEKLENLEKFPCFVVKADGALRAWA